MKTCKFDQCNNKVFSGGLCLFHFPKKPLKSKKKTIKKRSDSLVAIKKREDKKEWLRQVHEFELALWDKQEDKNGYCYCFETGTPMHRSVYRLNLCVYSHYYPKTSFKEFAMKEWNLEIIHPDTHSQWEANQQKCPKMYEKYQKLKEEYGK